ncbi:NAD-dependent epimerase/dehydratase family protein [Inquilinus limosus]|uniref:NAD-dependent epimerase/dehydratase family protein n=1 Tax=Inquilinus limosus TaxID=171674 RepID=UPI0009DD6F6F|nr:NAD-dependent epimerase/dehydratase family protein [Inquilinus limosus]
MIVVTGSAGYLGSRIVTSLLCGSTAGGGPVAGVDRAEAPTVTHRADILDGVTLRRAFRGARAVIHTAGLNGGPGAPAPAEEIRRINVGGTEAVIAAARDAGVRRLVLTSTTALYGGAVRGAGAAVWVTEDLPPAPETPYEDSKRDAEALVLAAAGSFPEGCMVLRCGRFFPAPPNETVNDRLYRGVDPRDVAAAHILAAERAGRRHRGSEHRRRQPLPAGGLRGAAPRSAAGAAAPAPLRRGRLPAAGLAAAGRDRPRHRHRRRAGRHRLRPPAQFPRGPGRAAVARCLAAPLRNRAGARLTRPLPWNFIVAAGPPRAI